MLSKNQFNKGIILTAFGSFWWGFIGVIYFKYIAFAGHIEVVLHRSAWTTVCLLYTSPSPRDSSESRMPSSA